MENRKIIHLEEPNTLSNFLTQEERENIEIDDELIQGCKRFLDELKRVEREKKKKEEEERKASEERKARRNYWAQKLYSDKRQAMTIIIPEDSKLKK